MSTREAALRIGIALEVALLALGLYMYSLPQSPSPTSKEVQLATTKIEWYPAVPKPHKPRIRPPRYRPRPRYIKPKVERTQTRERLPQLPSQKRAISPQTVRRPATQLRPQSSTAPRPVALPLPSALPSTHSQSRRTRYQRTQGHLRGDTSSTPQALKALQPHKQQQGTQRKRFQRKGAILKAYRTQARSYYKLTPQMGRRLRGTSVDHLRRRLRSWTRKLIATRSRRVYRDKRCCTVHAQRHSIVVKGIRGRWRLELWPLADNFMRWHQMPRTHTKEEVTRLLINRFAQWAKTARQP